MKRSKQLARKEHVTLKALVEEGLQLLLQKRSNRKPAPLKPVTCSGKGLSSEFQNASWEHIRQAAYNGHGS